MTVAPNRGQHRQEDSELTEHPVTDSPRPPSPGWGRSILVVVAAMVLAEVSGICLFLDGGEPGSLAVLRLAGGLTLVGAILFWKGRAAWHLLRSLRFAVVVLLFLLAASLIGTLCAQRDGSRDFQETFLRAEAGFVYNLLHPFSRFSTPPRERGALVDWLARRGVPEPDRWLARQEGSLDAQALLVDPDLAAYGRIYGARAEGERWHEAKKRIRAILTDAGTARHFEAHRSFYQALFTVAETTHFTRVWKSDWFAALITLLLLSLTAVLVRSGPLSLRRIGFIATHGGIVVIIVGAVIGRRFAENGILPLELPGRIGGESTGFPGAADRYVRRTVGMGSRLARFRGDLAVGLADFKALPHYRLKIRVRPTTALARSLPEGFNHPYYTRLVKLWPGARIPLLVDPEGRPRWRIRVEEFHPRVDRTMAWRAAPEASRGAVVLAPAGQKTDSEPLVLWGKVGRTETLDLPGGRLALVLRSGAKEAREWIDRQRGERYGTLSLQYDRGDPVELPLVPGASHTFPGEKGGVRVQVWRIMQSYNQSIWGNSSTLFGERLRERKESLPPAPDDRERNRDLPPDRPALALAVDGPEGPGGALPFRSRLGRPRDGPGLGAGQGPLSRPAGLLHLRSPRLSRPGEGHPGLYAGRLLPGGREGWAAGGGEALGQGGPVPPGRRGLRGARSASQGGLFPAAPAGRRGLVPPGPGRGAPGDRRARRDDGNGPGQHAGLGRGGRANRPLHRIRRRPEPVPGTCRAEGDAPGMAQPA